MLSLAKLVRSGFDFMKLYMCIYLRNKFQFFSEIVANCRLGLIVTRFPLRPHTHTHTHTHAHAHAHAHTHTTKWTPKKPAHIRDKIFLILALRICLLVYASTEQFSYNVLSNIVSVTYSNLQSMFLIVFKMVCLL